MKIRDLLNEDNKNASPFHLYNELTAVQIHALYRLSKDEIDPINISSKMEKTLDDLANLQLIDSAYSLTPLGDKILKISYSVHPKDVNDASSKTDAKRAMNRKERPEVVDIEEPVDMDDDDDAVEVDEPVTLDSQELGGTLAAPKKKKVKSNTKSLRGDDFDSFDNDDIKHIDDDGEYSFD